MKQNTLNCETEYTSVQCNDKDADKRDKFRVQSLEMKRQRERERYSLLSGVDKEQYLSTKRKYQCCYRSKKTASKWYVTFHQINKLSIVLAHLTLFFVIF